MITRARCVLGWALTVLSALALLRVVHLIRETIFLARLYLAWNLPTDSGGAPSRPGPQRRGW